MEKVRIYYSVEVKTKRATLDHIENAIRHLKDKTYQLLGEESGRYEVIYDVVMKADSLVIRD